MILDRFTDEILTPSISQNIPNPDKGVIETRYVEGIEIRLIKDGVPFGFNSVVTIPWALCALRDGKYIFAVSIEREDLREISHMTGTSVKTLLSEYGVKNYLLYPVLVMYGGGEREEIGRFPFTLDPDSVISYLNETLLDALDLIEDDDE